jgi:hypothetical protein
MCDAVSQRVGLSRSGTGNHQERTASGHPVLSETVLDSPSLFRVERLKICRTHGSEE